MRWTEEVVLLREEMRRVLAFLDWHAQWWVGRATANTELSLEHTEGLVAYAEKQVSIRRALRSSFDQLWRSEWAKIKHGEGADNAILDLGDSSVSYLTLYPQSTPSMSRLPT